MRVSKTSAFAVSFLCGLLVMLAVFYFNRSRRPSEEVANPAVAGLPFATRLYAPGIYVSEQISDRDVPTLKRQGFATIIDLRPDGEVPDQVPSAVIRREASANQLAFFYVPVPHGDIPDSAVTALSDALSKSPQPIIVYCRSGRRAARTLSLWQASRLNGPDSATILVMAKNVGQSADDLVPEINQRIANRKMSTGGSR